MIGLVALVARRWGDRRTIAIAWLATAACAAAYHWAGDPTRVVHRTVRRRPAGDAPVRVPHRARSPPCTRRTSGSSGRGRWSRSSPRCSPAHARCSSPSTCRRRRSCCCCPRSARRSIRSPDCCAASTSRYGVYLYAWPSQQIVAMYGWAGTPWRFIAISLVPTVALACASWFWVEAPLLRRFRPR